MAVEDRSCEDLIAGEDFRPVPDVTVVVIGLIHQRREFGN